MEKKSLFNIRYTMKPKDIMTFVSGLHQTQQEMIELVMASKEREGFPEASAVIQHIMEKKWNILFVNGVKKNGLSTKMNLSLMVNRWIIPHNNILNDTSFGLNVNIVISF